MVPNVDKTEYRFCLDIEVRDYECDIEGIVNNSVYMNYLEHARHKALNELGLNFKELVNNGIKFLVYKVEINYLKPLKAGDKIVVASNLSVISSLKILFAQNIYDSKMKTKFTTAKIYCTALNIRNRPEIPKYIMQKFLSL